MIQGEFFPSEAVHTEIPAQRVEIAAVEDEPRSATRSSMGQLALQNLNTIDTFGYGYPTNPTIRLGLE